MSQSDEVRIRKCGKCEQEFEANALGIKEHAAACKGKDAVPA